jgi:DNA-directed RNA polymerase specialized sigma24 family protein
MRRLTIEPALLQDDAGEVSSAVARALEPMALPLAAQRPSDKKARRVLGLHADGLSYRLIARSVRLTKNTVMVIVKRGAAARL